jgi:hypothetical protein
MAQTKAPRDAAGKDEGVSSQDAFKAYMERLVKLIPGEVLGVYLTIRGIFVPNNIMPDSQSDPVGAVFLDIWPIICLGLVVLVRAWGTRKANAKWWDAQWKAVFISAISFVIWVLAMGHFFWPIKIDDPRIASSAVVLWTFLVSYFYEGSDDG